MPVLNNRRNEEFCLSVVKDNDKAGAYKKAYPRCKNDEAARVSANRLLRNATISARITELRKGVAAVVVQETGIEEARVVKELEALAFSDLGELLSWGRTQKGRGANFVGLNPSTKIPEAARRALSSITQGADGQVTLKLHDKNTALRTLEERYRLLRTPAVPGVEVNVLYTDGPPRETYEQWTERRGRALTIEEKPVTADNS